MVAVAKIDTKQASKTEDLYMGEDGEAFACIISSLQLPDIELPKVVEFEVGHQAIR